MKNKEIAAPLSVLMVCHGNICRSTMAEFVLRDMVKKRGLHTLITVSSAGTSAEELGNPVHPGTRRKLKEHGISCDGKCAVQMKRSDYSQYDYLVGMEQRNVVQMLRILGGDPEHKVTRLLDYSNHPRDIADPWYTGDFDTVYSEVKEGCEALLSSLLEGSEVKN